MLGSFDPHSRVKRVAGQGQENGKEMADVLLGGGVVKAMSLVPRWLLLAIESRPHGFK
jgi:hypothetical protein